ncbi:hypothetical protein DM02DRAFT_610119 [Periconia macrospinosa]|uniref:Uncharacterized protein n=1 Tax=Periconia macrospinosa TaxID=97972 RepID=A0A2V1EA01_9PLEO|nr:hypothetical protein DM02DRAFT_610119 [Periconia macrospinosa]
MSEAPPTYSSPNPNNGAFPLPQHKGYDAYAYQQVAQAPMELSGESSLSAAPKTFVAELPDNPSLGAASPALSPMSPGINNGKAPVEMDTPVISPATPNRQSQARFQEVMDNRPPGN